MFLPPIARHASCVLVLVGAIAWALTWPTVARAEEGQDPCFDFGYGMPAGPLVAGLLDGDLGQGRRVCGRSEVGVGAGGLLIVDTMNFYGNLVGSITVDGSIAIRRRLELFASVEAFRYQAVITPVPSSYAGLGHTALGAALRFFTGEQVSMGLNGKVVLPTAFGLYRNAWPVAGDLGLAILLRARRGVYIHTQAGIAGSFALSRGDSDPRLGAVMTLGAELRPVPGFTFVADLHAGFGRTAPVDVFAGALGLRFSDKKRFGFEVGATIPIAGRERAAVSLELRASVRLGKFTPAAVRASPGGMPGVESESTPEPAPEPAPEAT